MHAAARAARPGRLLLIAPAEARRTSPATTASATACARSADDLLDDVHRDARRRASAPRSSAASCSAPTRSRSGYYDAYYGRAQQVRTLIAARLRRARSRTFDFVVTPTAPGVAFELGAKTADPLAMYLNDYCTVPMSLAGHPGDLDPERARPRACRSASRSPARPSARTGILDAAHALEQALGFDGSPARRRHDRVRTRHRPGDPRPARDADEDVLRLRAELRRAAEHAHLPGLPRPARHAAGDQRPGDPLRDHDGPGARAARSRRARSSTARTTSIPTWPRATRSPSTTSRSAAAGSWATCASTASTSRRTRPSSCTSATSGRIHGSDASSSTTTAAARRWPRSSPSPTSTRPSRRASGCTLLRETLRQLGVSDVDMERGLAALRRQRLDPPRGQRPSWAPRPSSRT